MSKKHVHVVTVLLSLCLANAYATEEVAPIPIVGPTGPAGPAGAPGLDGTTSIQDDMGVASLRGRLAATGLAAGCQDSPPAGMHSVTLCSGYWRGGVSGGGIGYDYVTQSAQWRVGLSAGHSSGEGVVMGRISRRF